MTKAEEIKKLKAEVKQLKAEKKILIDEYYKQKQQLMAEVQAIMSR